MLYQVNCEKNVFDRKMGPLANGALCLSTPKHMVNPTLTITQVCMHQKILLPSYYGLNIYKGQSKTILVIVSSFDFRLLITSSNWSYHVLEMNSSFVVKKGRSTKYTIIDRSRYKYKMISNYQSYIMSDCCLRQTKQFFSYIMARTSYIP